MSDLLNTKLKNNASDNYDASQIEVLEGLEPVRKRPGMYIGGTDDRAYHHLAGEILDNSMDEAVAGHADKISMTLNADGSLTISDNGRGIPIDEHPKFKGTSALEVILTTLHSGGKFTEGAYQTSGGLHGVGSSVVNALSEWMWVEVAKNKTLYKQSYSKGKTTSKLENLGNVNRRGTTVSFYPDPEIFGTAMKFKPARLYKLARSKAYLYRGVQISWKCDPSLLSKDDDTPEEAVFSFPNGLADYLSSVLGETKLVTGSIFSGLLNFPEDKGRVEFAITWPDTMREGFIHSYCNTIPTPQGGTHESGLRSALLKSLKGYGEMVGERKAGNITSDDIFSGATILLSVFIKDPQFQGQTKEKLATIEAAKLVENAIKDQFDLWLSSDTGASKKLLDRMILIADERLRKKEDRIMNRKSATQKLRLPGKLADCSRNAADDTEIFIVEGDSAGGSAKQARNRETQAILPLRGKILNVVSASKDKIRGNQEVQDMIQALGCGSGLDFDLSKLRYERVIIMTDADVDGAHIASLLVTFFYTQMRGLIEEGHLYLAQPPLYRLAAKGRTAYAMTDMHKDQLMETEFKGLKKVEVSRFKGLGEMPARQLKETTMDPKSRTLLRVTLPDAQNVAESLDEEQMDSVVDVDQLVEDLMGKNAEARFNFIQANADRADDLDV